jgi:hypothetical protein
MAPNIAGPSSGTAVGQLAAPQWRQFTFFDSEEVKDSEDLASSPRVLRVCVVYSSNYSADRQDLHPSAVICPTSPLSPLPPAIIVSSGQAITFVDRHLAAERSFTAWESNGRAIAMEEAGGILVAIGEEEGSRWPVLKIWDLTREDKKKGGVGGPVLMRNVKIQHGQRPHPVSSMGDETVIADDRYHVWPSRQICLIWP